MSQASRLWDLIYAKIDLLVNKLVQIAQERIYSFSDGLFQLRAEDLGYGTSSTANAKVNIIFLLL